MIAKGVFIIKKLIILLLITIIWFPINDSYAKSKVSKTYKRAIRVKATAYTPSRKECGRNHRKTATMKRPIPGHHVAVSRDLRWMLGKRVRIKGVGVRQVEDLMNKKYRRRIDIMMSSVRNAKEFGVQDVRMVIIN